MFYPEGQSLQGVFYLAGQSLWGALYPEGQALWGAFYPAGQSLRLTSPLLKNIFLHVKGYFNMSKILIGNLNENNNNFF